MDKSETIQVLKGMHAECVHNLRTYDSMLAVKDREKILLSYSRKIRALEIAIKAVMYNDSIPIVKIG